MKADWQMLQKEIYTDMVKAGFWPSDVSVPEKLCLIHSEISEALEDYRNNSMKLSFGVNGKPIGFPTELADAVIRIMDLAERERERRD